MGCRNTKGVSKPVVIANEKPSILTPAVMRRNLRTEMVMNKAKIHKLEDQIVRKKADYYLLNSQKGPQDKIKEITGEITKLQSKVFHCQTHNMILELHLETAAPGQYPNQKFMKKIRSRNSGLSKLSTFASTKINSGTEFSLRPNDFSGLIPSDRESRNNKDFIK